LKQQRTVPIKQTLRSGMYFTDEGLHGYIQLRDTLWLITMSYKH
jgi:hypothetical protein